MTKREQIVYKTMSENIARAGEFGLCPGPFVAMRAEYRRVVRREQTHFLLEFMLPSKATVSAGFPPRC